MQPKKIHSVLFFAVLAVFPSASISANSHKVTDFGAVGDGVTLNTRAIQEAVDQVSRKGGGTVYFPPGVYLSGTVYLRDHICLNLESGAVLLGSRNVQDYPLNISRYASGSDRYVARALLWGEELHDITLTGKGTIDGQGAFFAANRPATKEYQDLLRAFPDPRRFPVEAHYINRPYLIRLISCRNVLVEKLSLQKPAMWLQHYLNCDTVTLRDLNIYSHGSPNNDLIDIDGSRNVVISGCIGDSDDDGITLKSTSAAPVQNVTISDCIIRTRTNAIKAGTESSGGFKDVVITNCVLKPSLTTKGYSGRPEGLAGIALEIVDGGTMDRVTISNIAVEDMAAPIFLRLGNRARPYLTQQATAPVGRLRNVKISHLTATNAGRNGCSLLGIKDHPIENVSLSDISIHFDGGGTRAQAEAEYPEKDAEYPESTRYGDLPAYGFFCRHVDGLSFRDVRLSYEAPEERPPFLFEDVKNLSLFHVEGQVSAAARAMLILRDSHDVFISESFLPEMNSFLSLEKKSGRIRVLGNDFSRVRQPFVLDETVTMSALEAVYNLPADRSLFSLLQPSVSRDQDGRLTMRSFTPGGSIHYTLDGSEVTRTSPSYTQPLVQVGPCRVKAKVYRAEQESDVASLVLPALQVRKPEILPANSFFKDTISVVLQSRTPGAEIRYATEESAPVERGTVYTGPFQLKQSAVVRAQAFQQGLQPSEIAVSRFESLPEKSGVFYKCYPGEWDRLPNLAEMKPGKTGWTRQFRLDDLEMPRENYALWMAGVLQVGKSGQYTIYCESNDGSQLYLDHALLIDNDGAHGLTEVSKEIFLREGFHAMEVRFFQMGGSQGLKISWKGGDFEKTEISAESLQGAPGKP